MISKDCGLLKHLKEKKLSINMIKQITLSDSFDRDDQLTIGKIISKRLKGVKEFNQCQIVTSDEPIKSEWKWKITVTRDTYK